jgi:hypothetical protein
MGAGGVLVFRGAADLEVPARRGEKANREGAPVLYGPAAGSFLITDIRMTPDSRPLYAVTLLLAFLSLWLWMKRRRRIAQMVKRAVASMVKEPQA